MSEIQQVIVGLLMSQWGQSMALRQPTAIMAHDKTVPVGIVNAIEVESGSGLTYNLTLSDGRKVFVDVRDYEKVGRFPE